MGDENQIMHLSKDLTLQKLNEGTSETIHMMNYISKTYGNVGGLWTQGKSKWRKNTQADDKKIREDAQQLHVRQHCLKVLFARSRVWWPLDSESAKYSCFLFSPRSNPKTVN